MPSCKIISTNKGEREEWTASSQGKPWWKQNLTTLLSPHPGVGVRNGQHIANAFNCTCIFHFCTFLSPLWYQRHEITCFAVLLTTWARYEKESISSFFLENVYTNLIPGPDKKWERFQGIAFVCLFVCFFFVKLWTFLYVSRCKALGDFLISFLKMDITKGCLGDISQNLSFRNWFEILDIFRY